MKKSIFLIAGALLIVFILIIRLAVPSAKTIITVHNLVDVSRENEMVEVPLEKLGLKSNSIFTITDDKGVETPYQILKNGNVIFPVG